MVVVGGGGGIVVVGVVVCGWLVGVVVRRRIRHLRADNKGSSSGMLPRCGKQSGREETNALKAREANPEVSPTTPVKITGALVGIP